jgi:RimJ/RimL family protein N-acetyltransferase
LQDNQAFIEFIFVKDEYRRKHIYSELFRYVAAKFPDTEFSCIVNSFNQPSIKAQLRLGFRRSGYLTYLRWFGTLAAVIRFNRLRRFYRFDC